MGGKKKSGSGFYGHGLANSQYQRETCGQIIETAQQPSVTPTVNGKKVRSEWSLEKKMIIP